MKLGSGSTFSNEPSAALGKCLSGTFARPPPGIGIRLNDFFMPKKMEFKGWVTDYKRCKVEGLTDTEVSNSIMDLQKMVPEQYQKYIDWDRIRSEHGTWPTKTFVNMWFKNETNLTTMVGKLDAELQKATYKLHGQEVSSRLEVG